MGGVKQCSVFLFFLTSLSKRNYSFMKNMIINIKALRHIPSIRSTPRFLHGIPRGRKPRNDFLILKQDYIHLIYQHQLEWGYNPLALPAPTRRKHRLPNLQAPTWKNLQLPALHHPATLKCMRVSTYHCHCPIIVVIIFFNKPLKNSSINFIFKL